MNDDLPECNDSFNWRQIDDVLYYSKHFEQAWISRRFYYINHLDMKNYDLNHWERWKFHIHHFQWLLRFYVKENLWLEAQYCHIIWKLSKYFSLSLISGKFSDVHEIGTEWAPYAVFFFSAVGPFTPISLTHAGSHSGASAVMSLPLNLFFYENLNRFQIECIRGSYHNLPEFGKFWLAFSIGQIMIKRNVTQ